MGRHHGARLLLDQGGLGHPHGASLVMLSYPLSQSSFSILREFQSPVSVVLLKEVNPICFPGLTPWEVN